MRYDPKRDLHVQIAALLQITPTPFDESRQEILDTIGRIRLQRDDALQAVVDVQCLLVKSAKIGDLESDVVSGVKQLINERDALRNELNELRGMTGMTPAEQRYVLHGDIQPCTVLYSDHTTTLLRLPEGDMMLETETIEWSDETTYRCQELLKRVIVNNSANSVSPMYTKALSQLVTDNRILLVEDVADSGVGEIEMQCCSQCGHEFDETLTLCPQCQYIPTPAPFVAAAFPCPPAPAPAPSCNNHYQHTAHFEEKSMRDAGWTTEGLVQNGYGHYIPQQQPPKEF